MLNFFKDLVSGFPANRAEVSPEQELHLAAAALLVEVMMADHEVDEHEVTQLVMVLHELFAISDQECQFLYEQARNRHEQLVSLTSLTRLINARKDQDLKRSIVYSMWCIALSDGVKDKYEEHLIRKVADLLYVSHNDFIKARIDAETRYTQ